jgi:hypothetical protein
MPRNSKQTSQGLNPFPPSPLWSGGRRRAPPSHRKAMRIANLRASHVSDGFRWIGRASATLVRGRVTLSVPQWAPRSVAGVYNLTAAILCALGSALGAVAPTWGAAVSTFGCLAWVRGSVHYPEPRQGGSRRRRRVAMAGQVPRARGRRRCRAGLSGGATRGRSGRPVFPRRSGSRRLGELTPPSTIVP